jgi:hypothetical protein
VQLLDQRRQLVWMWNAEAVNPGNPKGTTLLVKQSPMVRPGESDQTYNQDCPGLREHGLETARRGVGSACGTVKYSSEIECVLKAAERLFASVAANDE